MAQPAAKRPRADTTDSGAGNLTRTSVTPSFDCAGAVSRLPEKKVRELLLQAARTNPGILALIKVETDRLDGIERAKIIDFDHLSKTAWRAINVDYADLKSSYQYERSGDVYHTVLDCFKTIDEGCGPAASFGTRKNGLEACRKIGKTICLSEGDVICDRVQSLFQYDKTLEDIMMKIAGSLTETERNSIMSTGGWGQKLEELVDLSKPICLFKGLPKVVRVMRGDAATGIDCNTSSKPIEIL